MRMLAGALRPRGVLVLYNAQYLLEDSGVAAAFDPVTPGRHKHNGWLEKYDRSSRRITRVTGTWRGVSAPLNEWRGAIRRDLPELDDLSVLELAAYEHELIDPEQCPDLHTTLWRKRG